MVTFFVQRLQTYKKFFHKTRFNVFFLIFRKIYDIRHDLI